MQFWRLDEMSRTGYVGIGKLNGKGFKDKSVNTFGIHTHY